MLFSRSIAILALLPCLAMAQQQGGGPTPAKPAPQSPFQQKMTVSSSGAFTVYGGTAEARSNVTNVADEVRRALMRELKQKDEGKSSVPIQVVLFGDPSKPQKGSAYSRSFGNKAAGGLYLRLNINQSRTITKEGMRSAVLEILLLQKCLAAQKQLADDASVVLHAWVVDGLLEVIDWHSEKEDRKHFARLAKHPQLFDLNKLLEVKRKGVESMDDATKKVYRAAAGAMVMAMVKQPGGTKHLNDMLEELALFQGEIRNLLKRHFPEMNKGKNGERVAWLLQLNEMAMTPLTESLSIIETEKRLNEALFFRVLDADGVEQVFNIEDFEAVAKLEQKKRAAAVALASKRVVELNYRCFPLYRSLLFQYGTILNALSQGKTEGVGDMVKRLADERRLNRAAATRARDFMDWYVLQNASTVTGNFAVFDLLEKQLRQQQEQANQGELKTYLDRLDALFASDTE